MTSVVRLLFQPAIWTCILLIMAPLSMMLISESEPSDRAELDQMQMPLYAISPGHTVFGEYVGAHWCPPCMDSASPSLANLKSSNPDEFTFVSFFESSDDGWPDDSPIGRTDHVMSGSTGYPTFSFADQQTGPCYKVGASGTNYYDPDFTAGGCMSSDSSDFLLEMSLDLNSTTGEVTVTLESTYTGPSSSVDAYLYGAVTERVGADAYDNGFRPHHNWRGWLLNDDEDGFAQMTLFKDATAERSWTVPLNTVRAAAGYTQWENFWPVIALMDGPHTSYNTFYAAVDPDMGPLIDVGITEFEVENQNQFPGFTPGDILDISLEIRNNGVDPYAEGGQIGVYLISGSDEVYLDGESVEDLGVAGTQSLDLEFDTSELTTTSSGVTTFRAMLTNLGSDRNSTNNLLDAVALHDMPPVPAHPSAVGATSFERGDAVQFESTALANDLVDDMTTMSPTLQHTKSGMTDWSDNWVTNSELVGTGGNAVYVHTLQTPATADSGHYDIRIQWQDAAGQQSEWLVNEEAFELQNALPRVLGSSDPGFAGYPTVKIDTLESISVAGLVRDAESPLSMLVIDSVDPEFKGWNSATSEVSVQFDTIETDPQGNPITQGVFVSIDDGEDVNHGMLLFNVIENGAPRWSPIPTQPMFEGGSASTSLTEFLSDTDDDGNPTSVAGLSLTIVSNSDEDLVQASINGHTVFVSAVNEDSYGVAEITVRADDGAKSSDSTVVFFVINVNDPPTISLGGIEALTLKANQPTSIDLASLMSDIDDPNDEIWLSATTSTPGALHYDYLNGILDMEWAEPGTHVVTLTMADRHGDWSTSDIVVTVLDKKVLTWQSDDQAGDLEVILVDPYVGLEPTVTIQNVGPLELSEVKTMWTVCNSIVGICHSVGTSDDLGPFSVVPVSGNGLAVGDYFTLHVEAVDSDGWDRASEDFLKITATQGAPDAEDPVDKDDDPNQLADDLTGQSETGILTLIGYAAIVILFIGIGSFAGLYLSQRNRGTDRAKKTSYGRGEIHDFELASEDPVPVPEPAPTAPAHPPIPEEGLPPGWTIEQWQYYGEEYLSRK